MYNTALLQVLFTWRDKKGPNLDLDHVCSAVIKVISLSEQSYSFLTHPFMSVRFAHVGKTSIVIKKGKLA